MGYSSSMTFGFLWQRLRFTIDEIIHHRYISLGAIIRSQRSRTIANLHPKDDWLWKCHSQERQAAICNWSLKGAQRITIFIEILEGSVIRVYIGVYRTEAVHGCWSVRSWHKEGQVH